MSSIVRQTAGVDYLTVTAVKPDAVNELVGRAKRYSEALKAEKIVGKDWKFKGYTGQTFGFFSWGIGASGGICMLNGPAADKYLELFLTDYERVTRIDLQTTVQFNQPFLNLGEKHWWEVRNCDKKQGASRSYRKVVGGDGGYTLYVGSRTSGKMLRVYDKGVQSESLAPGLLWRYELELKRPYAGPASMVFVQSASRAEYILGAIFTHCRTNGIAPAFVTEASHCEIEALAKVVTVDTKLNWLSTAVKPTVAYLADMGYTKEVLRALGLSQLNFTLPDELPENLAERI